MCYNNPIKDLQTPLIKKVWPRIARKIESTALGVPIWLRQNGDAKERLAVVAEHGG